MPVPLSLSKVHQAGPRWYRGDFHCHTHHSDGTLTPPELAQLARAEGLEFFAITDHNMTAAYPLFGEDAPVLIIPGIEATIKQGHFNVFGLEQPGEWVEQLVQGRPWREVTLNDHFRTTSDLMKAAVENGWLVSINHPLLKPWEWNDGQTDLRHLGALEIWNDPSWPTNVTGNPQAIALWTDLLNAGYRLTGIGGSDFHTPTPAPGSPAGKPAERLGLPSTYVYATELSGAAILEAVRRGRVWVSMGPQVAFEAQLAGATYGIGDDLAGNRGTVSLRAKAHGAAGEGVARLVKNGKTLVETPLADGGATLEWQGEIAPGGAGWFRLDVIDPAGLMLAITNPIYFGEQKPPTQTLAGQFIQGI